MSTNGTAKRLRLGAITATGALALTAGVTATAFASSGTSAAPATASSGAHVVHVGTAFDQGGKARIRPAIASKRSVVIARAQTWLTAHNGGPVPYSQTTYLNGWRTDCSGYVSMAWNLRTGASPNGKPINHNTDSMLRGGYGTPGPVVKPISWSQLKAGDAIGFLGAGSIGDAGHVMLFERWADSAHTSYWVYEQAGDGGTHHRTHPVSYNNYKPYRYDLIQEG